MHGSIDLSHITVKPLFLPFYQLTKFQMPLLWETLDETFTVDVGFRIRHRRPRQYGLPRNDFRISG